MAKFTPSNTALPDLDVDDGTLSVDEANNRVGIGTTSPDCALHVAGAAAQLLVGPAGATTHNIHVRSATDASIYLEADTDNTPESDNVFIKMTQDGNLVKSIFGLTGADDTDPEGTAYTGILNNSIFLGSPTTGVGVQLGTNDAVRFTVEPAGNVGIGTTTPNCALHVAGAAAFSGPSETFVTFGSSDTTPSVATGNLFKTHASTQTFTTFDDGVAGQTIVVISTAAVTFAISGGTLRCGTADIVTANADVTQWVHDGTNWYLLSWMDANANLADGSAGGF